jgi:hypothetical protein
VFEDIRQAFHDLLNGNVAPEDRRDICALSVVVHALMHAPDTLDAAAERVAAEAGIEARLVLRSARQIQEQLAEALQHGRAAA